MIYLTNDPYPQEISIPRSFGVIVPRRTEYLTGDDIATDLETDSDRKVLAASQGVRLKEMVDGKADADAVYTKQETDELLDDKADKDDTYTKQQVDTALAGKQDTINDLQTIRDGAAAGATAYQKPQSGIPASDLADGVIPPIPVEDVKVGGASVVTDKIAEIPAIPDAVVANPTIPAGTTPTDLQNLKVGDEYFSVPQGGGEPEIFWATYGVTTAQEIDQAVADGKAVACYYGGSCYWYAGKENAYYWFFNIYSSTIKRIYLYNGSWGTGWYNAQTTGNLSQSVPTDRTSTTKYPSVKAVFDEVHPAIGASIPSGGLLPNVFYELGELTGSVTIDLATPSVPGILNHYYFTFETGNTAPTITWGALITSWYGGSAPTISAGKHYEVSVINGVAVYMEV